MTPWAEASPRILSKADEERIEVPKWLTTTIKKVHLVSCPFGFRSNDFPIKRREQNANDGADGTNDAGSIRLREKNVRREIRGESGSCCWLTNSQVDWRSRYLSNPKNSWEVMPARLGCIFVNTASRWFNNLMGYSEKGIRWEIPTELVQMPSIKTFVIQPAGFSGTR